MFFNNILFLIGCIPFSISSSGWESPVTLFHSSKVTEKEGDYIKCFGIAVSPTTGDLYFGDEIFPRVFRIFNDEVQLVAGTGTVGYKDGPFISAQFSYLGGMSFGPNGSFLLVADRGNHIIRLLDFEKGSVSTIAGTPSQFGMSDGIRGKFKYPVDIAVDSSGKFAFVADYGNHLIRKVDLENGNVTTIAGTGNPEFNFKEGPAIKINLRYPMSVMYQEKSNLLFISAGDCTVRMINGTGYLKTILKDCKAISDPWGIVEKDNTTILVSDFTNNVIVSVNIYTSSSNIFAGGAHGGFFDGSRLEATFSRPTLLVAHPSGNGDIYISDYFNSAIRKLSKADFVSTEVRTIGSGFEDGYMGSARFSSPKHMALDEVNGILYVSDTNNHAIRRVFLKDNYKVDVLTGKPYGGYQDGHVDSALFSHPYSLLLDKQITDILYVCDTGNSVLRAIHLNQNLVYTTKSMDLGFSAIILKGTSPIEIPLMKFFGQSFNAHSAIWLNITNHTFVISAERLNSIWLGDFSKNIPTYSLLAGNPGVMGYKDGDAGSAKFAYAAGLVFHNGTLIIADKENYVIRSLDLSKLVVSTFFGSGKIGHRNGPSLISEFKGPNDIKMDSNGTFYIVDESAHAIRMIKDGVTETIAGYGARVLEINMNELSFGFECLSKISDSIYMISDKRNNVIFTLNLNETVNNIKPIIGSGMIGFKDGLGLNSILKEPTDIKLSLDNLRLFIADSGNHAIRVYDMKSGYLSTLFSSLSVGPTAKVTLKNPQGIALDTIENKLFISDTDNNGVKVIDLSTNTIELLAGSRVSSPGFKNSWFGEFATFANPIGIAVSMKDKAIFVCDRNNHAIRKVLYNGSVTTLANINGLPGFSDGNISSARFLYPTKLAISFTKNKMYILDSGNYRIRMIDLESEMISTVVESKGWPFHGIHIDELDNIFANNHRTIKMFLNNPSSAKSETFNKNYIHEVLIVVLICISVTIVTLVPLFLLVKKNARKNEKVTQKLGVIGVKNFEGYSETSKTLNISRTGHLLLDKSLNQIKFEISDTKSGGTAKVIKGQLVDPEMIKKIGIVDVAIKIVNRNEANKLFVSESFRYEVALMAALPESPFLVKLLGYCLNPMVILMKYYGMSMEECLQSNRFFTSSDIKLKAMIDVAQGMNLVHSKDIIHFDLKPGNILLDWEFQSNGNFAICDFGFADFSEDAERQFVAGMKKPSLKGITVRYAAPELLLKSFTFAHPAELKKVDVYAFAMIAYYIWFGKKAWGKESLESIQIKVIKSERPTFPQSTTESMTNLIEKCWDQSPSNRPHFKDIIKELRSFTFNNNK